MAEKTPAERLINEALEQVKEPYGQSCALVAIAMLLSDVSRNLEGILIVLQQGLVTRNASNF